MPKVTYGQLDNVLRSLGFSLRGIVEKNKVYSHEESGALIVYPVFPDEEEAMPTHVGKVRAILEAYGIANPLDFTTKLMKAS
jgi:hypothetical protein